MCPSIPDGRQITREASAVAWAAAAGALAVSSASNVAGANRLAAQAAAVMTMVRMTTPLGWLIALQERGWVAGTASRPSPSQALERGLVHRNLSGGGHAVSSAAFLLHTACQASPKEGNDGEGSLRPLRRSGWRLSQRLSARRFAATGGLSERADPSNTVGDRFSSGRIAGMCLRGTGLAQIPREPRPHTPGHLRQGRRQFRVRSRTERC